MKQNIYKWIVLLEKSLGGGCGGTGQEDNRGVCVRIILYIDIYIILRLCINIQPIDYNCVKGL